MGVTRPTQRAANPGARTGTGTITLGKPLVSLLTLFIFYEVLTISTWPLVTHKQNDAARAGGRRGGDVHDRTLCGEQRLGFGHLADLAVVALDGVGGVDEATDFRGELEHGRQVFPVVFPTAHGDGVAVAPSLSQT